MKTVIAINTLAGILALMLSGIAVLKVNKLSGDKPTSIIQSSPAISPSICEDNMVQETCRPT